MTDPVDHPHHYKALNGIEAIDVIEGFGLDFHLGNVVKYVLRAGHKGAELEDLRKAAWYLQRKIVRVWRKQAALEKLLAEGDQIIAKRNRRRARRKRS